jgi:hypothetical protein
VAGCWSSGCRRPGFRAGVARRRRPGGLEGVGVSVPAGSLRVVRRALRMMRAGMLKRIRPSGGRGAAAVGGQPAMTRAAGRSYGSPSRLASAATGRSGTFHRPTTRREVAPLQDIAAGASASRRSHPRPRPTSDQDSRPSAAEDHGWSHIPTDPSDSIPDEGASYGTPSIADVGRPTSLVGGAGRRDLALTTPGSMLGQGLHR